MRKGGIAMCIEQNDMMRVFAGQTASIPGFERTKTVSQSRLTGLPGITAHRTGISLIKYGLFDLFLTVKPVKAVIWLKENKLALTGFRPTAPAFTAYLDCMRRGASFGQPWERESGSCPRARGQLGVRGREVSEAASERIETP